MTPAVAPGLGVPLATALNQCVEVPTVDQQATHHAPIAGSRARQAHRRHMPRQDQVTQTPVTNAEILRARPQVQDARLLLGQPRSLYHKRRTGWSRLHHRSRGVSSTETLTKPDRRAATTTCCPAAT